VRQDFPQIRMRGPQDEALRPKYAHLEIERRWLVDADALRSWALEDAVEISDRYILDARLRLRRMQRGEEVVFKLTRKYECDDAIARPTVTAYLDPGEYDALCALTALPLTKTRYKVRRGEHDFSLDRFDGPLQGLWLSEIELADVDMLRALADPPWTVRDVTDDIQYQGATLARAGIPKD
jgi:CYTH domain-containing protein